MSDTNGFSEMNGRGHNGLNAVGGFWDGGEFWYRFLPLPVDPFETEEDPGDYPARASDGALPVLAILKGELWAGDPRKVFYEYEEIVPAPNCAVAFDAEEALHLLKNARLGEKLIVLNDSVVQELLSARRGYGQW